MGEMVGMESAVSVAERFRRFARFEAAGRSQTYKELSEYVSTDPLILAFLERLPISKRQPNLLFAAARYLTEEDVDPDSLSKIIEKQSDEMRTIMLEQRTQTNEALRCATLLPALACIPGPLALIEVGASAGLTLLVDFYSYEYQGQKVIGLDPEAPTLRCRPIGKVPIPKCVPEVVWRAGLDVEPLNPCSLRDMKWLSSFLWPGEMGRAERLNRAIATARRHPVEIYRGDLLDGLEEVAAKAPKEVTLVIYHTAVLAYVDEVKRLTFGSLVRSFGAVWLSNEAPGVVTSVGPQRASKHRGFTLVKNGSEHLADNDPHGSWIKWYGKV